MWETLQFIYLTAQLAALADRQARQVLALQQRRFRRLLQFASERSPFYRRRFHGIDLRTCRPTDLPPLTKAEMMNHFDELVTDRRVRRSGVERFMANLDNLGKYYLGRYVVCRTSGSQGQPAIIVQTRRDLLVTFAAQVARAHPITKTWTSFLSRLGNRSRMAVVTLRPGFYPSGVAFAYMPRSAKRFTNLLRLSVLDPLADSVAKLNDFQPNFLTGYASALEMLAREERDGRLQLRAKGSLQQLTNMSEPLSAEARQFIEKTFGVHVTDHYAMGECMPLSIGCPFYPGSHLNADLAMLEPVDDRYRPVAPGERGSKVLITNLCNFVQPFIRYEIDDVVTMSPRRCPCGSNLPLIQAIEGRTQDRFWIQVNGEYREVTPFAFRGGLDLCIEVGEFEILQTERNRFLIRAAPLPGKSLSAERIKSLVEQGLAEQGVGNAVDLDVEIVPEIMPDPRSGKKKKMKSLIGPPAELEEAGSIRPEAATVG